MLSRRQHALCFLRPKFRQPRRSGNRCLDFHLRNHGSLRRERDLPIQKKPKRRGLETSGDSDGVFAVDYLTYSGSGLVGTFRQFGRRPVARDVADSRARQIAESYQVGRMAAGIYLHGDFVDHILLSRLLQN